MAREYGNIFTAIWRDPDFIALPSDVQRTYLLVITQPDVSSCGVLPFMPARWAKYAPDTDPDSLRDSLSILHHNRYLIVDSDTDEVLIRSFIRYDRGYTNTKKRLPAILAAVDGMLSDTLRQVTVRELNRLGVDHGLAHPPIDSLSDSLLDSLWHTPRIQVVRNVSSYLNPEAGNQNPESGILEPEAGSTSSADAPDQADDYPSDFNEFWNTYPRRDGKRAAAKAYRSARKRDSQECILVGARRYRDDPNREDSFTAMATTWLNGDRWNDPPLPPRRDGVRGSPAIQRVATADQRLVDGMALAQRLAAEESQQRQIGA